MFAFPMNIGTISFSSPFFLAPLAGYSDAPFRRICHEWGSAAAVTEMVSAEGLARDSLKTEELMRRYEGEENLIIQIFGPDEDPVGRAIEKLKEYRPAMVDINCGCPVPKVVKTGAGSAMMQHPEKMAAIVRFLKDNTNTPVSVKFRLGWDYSSLNYLEFAKAAAEAGADMFTLHARTRSQGYSGSADWSHLKKLKEEFRNTPIKIFGSGDIFKPEDAKRMLEETLCDGVMFARGAIGNPFIFQQTKDLIAKGTYESIPLEKRKETLLRHLDYMIKAFGENLACRDMKKHACAYLKGLEGANKVKVKVVNASTREEYEEAISHLL